MPYKDPEQRRAHAREYAQRWRARNIETVKAANAQYRLDHALELREKAAGKRRADPEKGRVAARDYACRNSDKVRARHERYKAENPEKVKEVQRRSQLKSKYGLSVEDYDVLLEKQGGVCALCSSSCSTGRRLAVDHDHSTDQVRGLLCSNCNQGLGKFNDDAGLLRKALEYLEAAL